MLLRSIISILLFTFVIGADAQVSVNVFINGIKSGQYSIKADESKGGGIFYKKSVYKSAERLAIELKGNDMEKAMYKRSVDVTDGAEHSLYLATETPDIKGQFVISGKGILKRLAKGKPVTLYLLLNPANDKMMAPSRKLYIGSLSAK